MDGNGRPTLVPRIEDDVVEVRCKGDDRVVEYSVSDEELVAWEGVTTDRSAVQVQQFHVANDVRPGWGRATVLSVGTSLGGLVVRATRARSAASTSPCALR